MYPATKDNNSATSTPEATPSLDLAASTFTSDSLPNLAPPTHQKIMQIDAPNSPQSKFRGDSGGDTMTTKFCRSQGTVGKRGESGRAKKGKNPT